MNIKSQLKDYEVIFSENFDFVKELISIPNKLIVVDENVYNLYNESIFNLFDENDILIINAIESNKNIETALSICERMTKISAKRNAYIISFGGGIIQDISGFAANILYRGVRWIFVPTTLLAQTDSCIGSKTSLNYLHFKNLLGTFFPPDKIFIDTGFLATLNYRDYCSGLGEIVKFNVMNGSNKYNLLKSKTESLLSRDYTTVQEFIRSSLDYKAVLIQQDEFDYDIRLLLNYGHTFGHALESVSNYDVPHGQAIAVGMIIANIISEKRGLINAKIREEIQAICFKTINVTLCQDFFDSEHFINALKNDKKRQGTQIAAILLKDDLSLIRVFDIEKDEVIAALADLSKILCNR